MAKLKLTEQQQAAVENRGGSLLVSAAAGSGKTKVLVERLFRYVTEDHCHIDDFLIITYTKAAAAELRSKIAAELSKRMEDVAGSRTWFSDYLKWLTTHPYGVDEMNAKNNHGTCWVMQVAQYAKYTGDKEILDFCRNRYRSVLLPSQMAEDGSFPLELKRTKPYGYSLFNLDAMATICHILSDGEDDLWQYSMDDGRNMQKAVAWLFPYIADKSSWPFAEDVMFWDEWPVAQPALLFSICNTSNRTYLEIWKSLEHFPTNDEVIRNLPIRHPLLWL